MKHWFSKFIFLITLFSLPTGLSAMEEKGEWEVANLASAVGEIDDSCVTWNDMNTCASMLDAYFAGQANEHLVEVDRSFSTLILAAGHDHFKENFRHGEDGQLSPIFSTLIQATCDKDTHKKSLEALASFANSTNEDLSREALVAIAGALKSNDLGIRQPVREILFKIFTTANDPAVNERVVLSLVFHLLRDDDTVGLRASDLVAIFVCSKKKILVVVF